MSSKCFIILSKDFFIIYSKDFYSLPFLYLTSYLSALWPKLKGKFTFFFIFLTLQYCIGFAIHQHASATGVHMFPILNPPPHTIPLGHPNAPAPSFLYPTSNLNWQFVSYMILYMFNAILPNHPILSLSQFSLVQSLSCVRLFVTPRIAARQASLSITNSQS